MLFNKETRQRLASELLSSKETREEWLYSALNSSIGSKVRLNRKYRGWSQIDLAEKSKVNIALIVHLEN